MEVTGCKREDCSRQLESTIYIEDVFLLNLVMNLYLLKLLGKMLGRETSFRRLLLGSLTGAAMYCLFLCVTGAVYDWRTTMGMILVGLLMTKLTLKLKGKRRLLYATGWLYTFAFLLGGFILFLKGKSSFFQRYESSVMAVAAVGFLGYELIKSIIEGWRKKQSNRFCRVRVQGDTEEVEILALIDTGNGLIDPVSKKPVAVLEEEEWQKLKRWMRPEKYRMIPYHSIGCKGGLLEGYEVALIQVEDETGTRQYEKVIIAVLKGKLSKKGGYHMILPPELAI